MSHPTVLVSLTPAVVAGDIIDADLVTNLGTPVTFLANGEYDCAGGPTEYFNVRIQDVSQAGAWHAMSGPLGFRVYVGGTVRLLTDLAGMSPAAATASLTGQGFTVTQGNTYSPLVDIGEVVNSTPPLYSLVNAAQMIRILIAIGTARPGGVLSNLQYPEVRVVLPAEDLP